MLTSIFFYIFSYVYCFGELDLYDLLACKCVAKLVIHDLNQVCSSRIGHCKICSFKS